MAATAAPKFTVSFNSDTSDSEEESSTENETESEETEEEVPDVVKKIPVSVPSPKEVSHDPEEEPSAEFTFDLSYDSSVVNGLPPSPVENHNDEKPCAENFEFTFCVETDSNDTINSSGDIKGEIKSDLQLQNGTISDDIGLGKDTSNAERVIMLGSEEEILPACASVQPPASSRFEPEPTLPELDMGHKSADSCPGPCTTQEGDALNSSQDLTTTTATIKAPTNTQHQDKLSTDSSKTLSGPDFDETQEDTMTINTEVEVKQSVTIEAGDNDRAETTQTSKLPDEIRQTSEPPDKENKGVILVEGNVKAVGVKEDADLISLEDNLPSLKPDSQDIAGEENTNTSGSPTIQDKQRSFAAELSQSMDKPAEKSQKARSLYKTKSLPESPIQSPKYKSAADDDFEAGISRAKAFIQSSNGRYSVGDDKSKATSSNVSTTSSQADVKDVADNMEDQYILGTVAVTMGDKDEDQDNMTMTQSERSRRRKEDVDDIDAKMRNISENTNELIKRILAEARGEKYEPSEPGRRQEDREPMGEEDASTVDDYASSYGGYEARSSHPSHDEMGSMSLLGRRIESMKKRNAELASDDYRVKPKPQRYSYGNQPAEDPGQQMVLYDDNMSSISSRAESIRRKYRENWGHQQQYDGDDEVFATGPNEGALVPYIEPEDDDSPFAARRALMRQFVLPEEAFIPHKSEDTDDIVKERTTDIRNVVVKQESVLEELRKASQSFEEIEDEIKEIRQMFYESQERRKMIHEEIEYDLQIAKQNEEALAAQAFARRYAPLPEVDYTKGFLPSSKQPLAIAWNQDRGEEDMDDTASVSSHRGLAITRSSGWTGPGTRIGSAMSLDQGMDNLETQSMSSMPSYRPKARPSSARQAGRSMYDRSRARYMMENSENHSDMGDDSVSHDDDGDTLDGNDDGVTAPWRPRQQINGDAWRQRDNGNGEENVEVSDELSAKINSWRAKNEAEEEVGVPEEPSWKSSRGGDASWKSYLNHLENGDEGSGRMPVQNGLDSGYGSLRSRGRSGYGWGSTSTADDADVNASAGHKPYGLYNGNDDASTGVATSSWRSHLDTAAGDTGAHAWRSKYAQDQENARSTPRYSWQRSVSTMDNDSTYTSGCYGRIGKTYSADDTDTSPAYTSPYTSRFSRPSTRSDYEIPRHDRRARARSCEPVGFKSKFLDKVREQRSGGEGSADKTRSKPFKSRFLRASFGADTTKTSNESSKTTEVGAE